MLFLMLKDHLFFGTPAQPSSNLVSSNTCGISRRPIRYVRSARSHIVVGICIALERREFASSRDVVRIRMFPAIRYSAPKNHLDKPSLRGPRSRGIRTGMDETPGETAHVPST